MDKPQPPSSRFWLWLGLVCIVVVVSIYFIFFRVYQVGLRAVLVNGERVEYAQGFTVYRATWLSRADVQRFFSRLSLKEALLNNIQTKSYQGSLYIPSSSVVAVLRQTGVSSSFTPRRLAVTTSGGQHYQYVSNGDSVRQRSLWIRGHLVGHLLTVTHREAVYVSASELAASLRNGGLKAAFSGTALRVNLAAASAPIPINQPEDYVEIDYGSGNSLFAPRYRWYGETYIPIDSLSASLSQLGYASKLGRWTWNLTPRTSDAGSASPTILAFVPAYFGDLAAFTDVTQHASTYTALAADLWTVDSTGALGGSAPAGTTGPAAASGDRTYAMISNLGSAGANASEMTTLLTSPAARMKLQDSIVNLVTSEGYDGATLDFESIPPRNRKLYSRFVQHLAEQLHQAGKRLQVVIPPDTGSTSEPWNGAYDQAVLGTAADEVIVMAYDYSYPGGPPGAIAPIPWVSEVLAYTISRIPANKVLLGLDAYGYDWSAKQTVAVGLPNVDSFLQAHHITPKWDVSAMAPWFTWVDSTGGKHTVYYENGRSTALKLRMAAGYGVRGVAVWRAGLEDAAVLDALSKYGAPHH